MTIELTKASLSVTSRRLLDSRLLDTETSEGEVQKARLSVQQRLQEDYAALLAQLKDQYNKLGDVEQRKSVDVTLLEEDIVRLNRQIDVLAARMEELQL